MRRALALLPLCLAACAEALPSTAVIDKLRVIAIRAEPPEGAPGTSVNLDALVVDPLSAQRELASTWFACVPARGQAVTSCLSFATETPILCTLQPEAPFCVISVDNTASYQLPELALAGRPAGESGQVVITQVVAPAGTLTACADHFRNEGTPAPDCDVSIKRLVVSHAAHPNQNPSLADFQIDGMPVPALDAATVPTIMSDSKHTLSVVLGAGSVEAIDPPMNGLAVESPYLSYYTTDGKLDPVRTDAVETQSDLTAPSTPEALKLFVVVHDGRGGTAWTGGKIRVVSPVRSAKLRRRRGMARIWRLALLVLASCGSRVAATHPPQAGPPAAVTPAWFGDPGRVLPGTSGVLAHAAAPEWEWKLVAGGTQVAVLEPQARAVAAYDGSGRQVWRTTIASQGGLQSFRDLDGALVVWSGWRMFFLDPATGRITHDVAGEQHTEKGESCWDRSEGGVCAFRCPCSFQLFDCHTGARIGDVYQQSWMEEFDNRGGAWSGCMNGGELLGRAGGLAIFTSDNAKPTDAMPGPRMTVAVDLATGKEAWRSAAPNDAFTVSAETSGIAPDAQTCWVGGHPELRVFECATGWQLWNRQISGYQIVTHLSPEGLFAASEERAGMYDLASGRPRWERVLAHGTVTSVPGSPINVFALDQPRDFRLLDPADGSEMLALDLGKGESLGWQGDELVRAGKAVTRWDAAGRLLGTTPLDAPIMHDTFALVSRGAETVLVDRKDGHVRARLPAAWRLIAIEGALGPGRLMAVRETARPGTGGQPHESELIVLEVSP